MTERWKHYFDEQGAFDRRWLSSAVTHWGFNEVLYGMIGRYISTPAKILDVGCGPGWSDLYLTSAGYEVVGIDNERSLVDQARGVAERLGIPTRFEVADAFDLKSYYGQFDLSYSCGVLEHFDREVTVRLLSEQGRCAKYVLIQIPTRFTAYGIPLTDERIYTVDQLKQIVRDAGLHVVTSFGYGDVTVTRSQIWLRRLLPRMMWRGLQDRGFAFSIGVLGSKAPA